jgi:hypothetical protein
MGEKGGENLIAKLRDYKITRLQDSVSLSIFSKYSIL